MFTVGATQLARVPYVIWLGWVSRALIRAPISFFGLEIKYNEILLVFDGRKSYRHHFILFNRRFCPCHAEQSSFGT
jgi:hypothetical protein